MSISEKDIKQFSSCPPEFQLVILAALEEQADVMLQKMAETAMPGQNITDKLGDLLQRINIYTMVIFQQEYNRLFPDGEEEKTYWVKMKIAVCPTEQELQEYRNGIYQKQKELSEEDFFSETVKTISALGKEISKDNVPDKVSQAIYIYEHMTESILLNTLYQKYHLDFRLVEMPGESKVVEKPLTSYQN